MKQMLSERRRLQICRILDGVSVLAGVGILFHMLLFVIGTYNAGMEGACNLCIRALRDMAEDTGWTYEAINVVLFIFLEPLAIGFNILLFFFHKYTFSHVFLAIESVCSFLLITSVCGYVYVLEFDRLVTQIGAN